MTNDGTQEGRDLARPPAANGNVVSLDSAQAADAGAECTTPICSRCSRSKIEPGILDRLDRGRQPVVDERIEATRLFRGQ